MKRAKLQLTVRAPTGGTVERLLQALRDMGYTVGESVEARTSKFVSVDVLAPYGEVEK